MKYRLRLTYSVRGPMRYSSNLDRMRAWARAARRAGLPLLYSQGFNPRPRIQVAAPLPVGFAGAAEMLDLWLVQPVEPPAARQRLARTLPEGLALLQVAPIDPAAPPLPTCVQAAEYRVLVETAAPAAVHARLKALLSAASLPRQRRGRSYDLRPLVQRLWVEREQPAEVTLGMLLAAREGATGRPEEVLDALDLADRFFRVTRQRLLFAA